MKLAVAAILALGMGVGPLAAQESILDQEVPLQDTPIEQTILEPVAPKKDAEIGYGAVLRGLDKVNGQTTDAELRNGASTEVFGLIVTLSECRHPADNPTGDAFAHLTIRAPGSGDVFFDGWMIASSPALNALDHSRYDVWVLRCMTS